MRKFIPCILSLCLAVGLSIATEAIAFAQSDEDQKTESASKKDSAYVSGITSARARSLVGGVLGLLSLIIGWRAKARSTVNPKIARPWSIASLVSGLAAMILSIVHLANHTGDFGTGGGKAGAIVALVLGLMGTTLGVVALRQSGR